MKVTYSQLFLGLGTYESSRVSTILVTSLDGGSDTWQEAITNFRQVIMNICRLRLDEKSVSCSRCKKMPIGAKFCDQCGKPIIEFRSESICVEAAALFREWFDLETHQFDDFDLLEESGWQIGIHADSDDVSPVGWVEVDGFDQLLESWDDTELSSVDVRTGTFTVDQ